MDKGGSLPLDASTVTEAAWYCLQAKYKHEHVAAAHLKELKGVHVFCPRIRFRRQTRLGLVRTTEALFPGYLFAHFSLEKMQRAVAFSPGVRCIVRFASRYPKIEEETVAQLRAHVGEREIKEMDYEPSQGDNVTVAEGPFAGLEAVITQILPAGARVRALMDFLGRKVEAELESKTIRKIGLPDTTHV
jgi:transcriptional antiterminator RfaH